MELWASAKIPTGHPRGGAARFRPVNLDVLPLYIIPAGLLPLRAAGGRALAAWRHRVSLAVYAATCHYDWNLPAYPEGKVWYFNPMAWQVVFYVGAACTMLGRELAWLDRFRWRFPCWPYCIFCFRPLSPCPAL
jgi:hypothetical protein